MATGDQAERSDWRRRLRAMRTLKGLRAATPEPAALAALDAEELSAAAENPDHSEAGRAAAREAARERAIELKPWRLAVPGFLKSADLEKGDKLFFGFGRGLRKWSGVAFWVVALFAVCSAALPGRASPNTSVVLEWLDAQVAASPLLAVALALLSTTVAIWFIASILRRKPARAALLRKANARAFEAPLERMITHELRPYGHIASLSDRYARGDLFGWLATATLSFANPLGLVWYVLGAPARLAFRFFDRSGMGPATVLSASDYRKFARRLPDRIGLNAQMAMSAREAFQVRSSEAWWPLTARLLIDSSDVIIVDLTKVAAGAAWELDLIQESGAAARCVFVSLWGKGEEADAALKARGLQNVCHFYAPDGRFVDRHRFRAAMLGAIAATHGAPT